MPDLDRLAPFRDLRAERQRREDTHFVCEGSYCIRRAIAHGYVPETLLTTRSQLDAMGELPAATHVIVADNAELEAITGFNFHRGCLAHIAKPVLGEPRFDRLADHSLVLFAEDVSNPANLGALLRNARSFGVDRVVLTPGCAEPFSRQAVRASMGNVFGLALSVTSDLAGAIRAYPGQTLAATLRGQPLDRVTKVAHRGVVVGTENTGLLASTIAACHSEVTIPMAEDADSLNVAAASAVLLYGLRA